jgi:nigerose phosphorylase
MITMEVAIFDLDGVIVDTAKYHYLAWKRLASELGFDFSMADNERLKGVSRMRSLEIVLETGGLKLTETQQVEMADKKNHWYLEYIQKITPADILPGVISFIARLRSQQVKIALGTASKNAALILEKLGITALFDAIVDGNQVSKAKPDPEVFLECARRLGVHPWQCVVFEDAAAGVQAGKNAGMRVVGVGDGQRLSQADFVIQNFASLDFSLVTGAATADEFLLKETRFVPDHIELNGSKFLLGNGYMGYRGTLEEYSKGNQVACTLAGIYDRMGGAWREPVNAPNGFHTILYCNHQALEVPAVPPETHIQWLDIRRAIHHRETVFALGPNKVRITVERFLSLDNVHQMALKYRFQSEMETPMIIYTGIDGDVWDINGPHLRNMETAVLDHQLTATAVTNEGETVAVAEVLDWNCGLAEIVTAENAIHRRITIKAEPGREYCFYKYVAIYTGKDGVADPLRAAMADNRAAFHAGYDRLFFRHAQLWHERWLHSDVIIAGDPDAQFALRYSVYQLLLAAPAHTDKNSIPARSLSSQTYKGAIYWDTELFMLPFFLYTNPAVAKNIVKYRIHTLDGARRKAAEYGYRGAFYAWESQENGDDACTLFNINDVFSGRPMRTYFRDKQIHISADVTHAIWQYYLLTGDEGILLEGGDEVILECARFYYSYAYYKKDKQRYEILDVIGPDEYHDRVSNNAFTNSMVKYNLEIAMAVLEFLSKNHPAHYRSLISKIGFEDDIPVIKEMADQLFVPAPAPDTGIIEQFDGYHRLADISLNELKRQIQIPNEYWGGSNGLATNTKIIKQADVMMLFHIFKNRFSHKIKTINWEYYEPRTEHGSSLSACVYAILAANIGKPDWAYRYFMKTATIDLTGDYKRYVGDLYIGGTHPAANGGAWMAAVFGFGGLDYDGQAEIITLNPALPARWNSLSFAIRIRNQGFQVEISGRQVKLKAAMENTGSLRFNITGLTAECGPGQEITVDYHPKEAIFRFDDTENLKAV